MIIASKRLLCQNRKVISNSFKTNKLNLLTANNLIFENKIIFFLDKLNIICYTIYVKENETFRKGKGK